MKITICKNLRRFKQHLTLSQAPAETSEISGNAAQTSAGTPDAKTNIIAINRAAGETEKATGLISEASDQMSRQAAALRADVRTYRGAIRAA